MEFEPGVTTLLYYGIGNVSGVIPAAGNRTTSVWLSNRVQSCQAGDRGTEVYDPSRNSSSNGTQHPESVASYHPSNLNRMGSDSLS